MGLAGCVHLVDKDIQARGVLAGLLAGAGCEVRPYACAADILEQLPEIPGGCVLVDLATGGLGLVRRLAAAGPHLQTVLLAAGAQVQTAVEAFHAGARDFVEKPVEADKLLPAVAAALRAADLASRAQALRAATAERLARLTGRERDVLQGVVDGLSSKEIARSLAISPRTVECYRSSLMIKTEAASLPDLVRLTLLAEAA